MKRLLLIQLSTAILFLIFLLPCAQSQDTLALVKEITIAVPNVKDVDLDPLGNIYVITSLGAIEKYDATGSKRTVFTQNRLGYPAAIFARNAQKIIAWYPEFKTIVLLDRNLVQLGGTLNLIEKGFPNAVVLSPSVDGHIWLYDEVRFKLLKMSPEGIVLFESQGLDLLLQRGVSLISLVDNGQHVIAHDPAIGLLFFDLFGQYKRQKSVANAIVQLYSSDARLRWIDTLDRFFEMDIEFPFAEKSWCLPKVLEGVNKKITPTGFVTWDREGIQVWKR
jgi:hypothetical protein